MEIARHRRRFGGTLLATIAGADPGMDFAHGPDGPALNQFDDAPVIVPGMNLGAQLRDAFLLARGFADDAAFGNGVREWLLAVDVPATLERRNSYDGMRMVGCADDQRIDAFLIEQAAKIIVLFCVRIFLRS